MTARSYALSLWSFGCPSRSCQSPQRSLERVVQFKERGIGLLEVVDRRGGDVFGQRRGVRFFALGRELPERAGLAEHRVAARLEAPKMVLDLWDRTGGQLSERVDLRETLHP